jgi:hypothetical protein
MKRLNDVFRERKASPRLRARAETHLYVSIQTAFRVSLSLATDRFRSRPP